MKCLKKTTLDERSHNMWHNAAKRDAERLLMRNHKAAGAKTRKSKAAMVKGKKRPGQLAKANGYRP